MFIKHKHDKQYIKREEYNKEHSLGHLDYKFPKTVAEVFKSAVRKEDNSNSKGPSNADKNRKLEYFVGAGCSSTSASSIEASKAGR